MSLTGAINIGRSALAAGQIGIQLTGNNMANAATPGYSRQVGRLASLRGDASISGISIGSGVQMRSVLRQVDSALQSRIYSATSDFSGAAVLSNIYTQIETTLGELGDNDLSSELSNFFRTWSERANQTSSSGSVVQQADRLSGFIRNLRSQLTDQQRQIESELGNSVTQANELIQSVADLNRAIADAEVSGTTANVLRDQRDATIEELSSLIDVNVVDRGQGGFDVLVGSTPVVLSGQARGLQLKREAVDGQTRVSVSTIADEQRLSVQSGQIGALLNARENALGSTIQRLDSLSSTMIFEVNKLHSTAVNRNGMTSATGTLRVGTADQSLALNDPANQAFHNLPFRAVNGGFEVVVKQSATGTSQTVRINVDLDGITAAGAPGTADDTSLEDIRAALAAVPGLTASYSPDGKLEIKASDGYEFSFNNDSSGALAVLGVGAFFTGTSAADIGVRADLKADPTKLMVGRIIDNKLVENGTALAITNLQAKGLESISGQTIQELWRGTAQAVGADSAASLIQAESNGIVRDGLDAQRSAISGVSIDEESINLLDYQRQYQAAARLISVADELTRTLIDLV